MEQEMNLTPSQVEELRELGVEFDNTQMVYVKCVNYDRHDNSKTIESDWFIQRRKEYEECIFAPLRKWCISAPTLQEGLEKLPVIKTMSDEDNYLENGRVSGHIYYPELIKREQGWFLTYTNGILSHKELYESDFNQNPLNVVMQGLRWVSTNYPKSLTNKTE